MQPDLNRVIEQVSKEKGIDRALIVEALENAMVSAARKTFGADRRIEGRFNPELGEVELFEIKTVVDTLCSELVGQIADTNGGFHQIPNFAKTTVKMASARRMRNTA